MVRQIDIARKTGFSLGVVSRALRSEKDPYDRISEETRVIIRKAAEEMGYTCNLQASLLRRGKLPAIRVLLPAWTSPDITRLTMGISRTALEYGYPLMIHHYNENEDMDYLSFLESVCREKNTGVLFYLHQRMERKVLRKGCEKYVASGGKIVFMNDRNFNFDDLLPDMVTLNIDEEDSGRLAAEYLQGLSCRSYSVVYNSENAYDVFRKKGFEDGLRGTDGVCFPLDFPRVGEPYGDFVVRSRKIFDAFFDGAGEIAGYPLGLFFTSSFLVYLVMNEFATRGFRLNEELHPIMVEYKNISHYPFFYTPRIIMPFYEMGVAAMEKLAGMLKGAQEKSLLLRPSILCNYHV